MQLASHSHDSPRLSRTWIAWRRFWFSAAAALLVWSPLPSQISGTSETRGKIDLSFLQAGSTTRDEVFQKLDWINTGVQEKDLFVGRWSVLSTEWVWGWAPPPIYSLPQLQKVWKANTVLVEFDAAGIVKKYRIVKDPDLIGEVSAWIQSQRSLAPAPVKPETIPVKHRHASGKYYAASLKLGEDSLEFHEVGNASHDFSIARGRLGALSSSNAPRDAKSDPREIGCRLDFREKTKAGSHLALVMDIPALFALVEYLKQDRNTPAQR